MQTQAKTNQNKSNNALISTASKIQMMLMHLGECLFLKLFHEPYEGSLETLLLKILGSQ